MPENYAFSGRTAAWLLGLDFAPCEPVEVTVDRSVPVRARAGIRVRRAALSESEVIAVRGMRATYGLRTVRDLGSGREVMDAIVAIEMAVRAGVVEMADVANFVLANQGAKGIKRLRRAVAFAEPRSESPMETRQRLELVKARLPCPEVQANLFDAAGAFIGRADLYYPDRSLVIEYDGSTHRDRLVTDLRRQNALLNAGYHVLRFTAPDLQTPDLVVTQVRRARARLAKVSVSPDYPAKRVHSTSG
jgi:very-short-patch-repair endonuclease